jgi:hypothetical protein
MGYFKHILSKAISYTFTRMTVYLTIFNFCLLCFWMYDNTPVGDWMKEENLRAGDLILVVIFSLFAISALEYILIGRENEEDTYK